MALDIETGAIGGEKKSLNFYFPNCLLQFGEH